MAKELVLNQAVNRWELNKKRSVGPVSQWIRETAPQKVGDWENSYLQKLAEKLKTDGIDINPNEYLNGLGQKLYIKITEVIHAEIEEVTEDDCINYIRNLIINRTYDGYQTEITTIYGQLQRFLGETIQPAPDQWDRGYNVDFFIKINNSYIGLQIKPVTYEQIPDLHKWKNWLGKSHAKFTKKFGGKVLTIFSIKEGKTKKIHNSEIIEEIKSEIARLQDTNEP